MNATQKIKINKNRNLISVFITSIKNSKFISFFCGCLTICTQLILTSNIVIKFFNHSFYGTYYLCAYPAA